MKNEESTAKTPRPQRIKEKKQWLLAVSNQ